MVVYDKKYPVKTLLKKRYIKKPKDIVLKFGDNGICFERNFRFEFIYLLYLRKFLKKNLKKKKLFFKFSKVWVFIRPNHVMTKKSKNSRMGKGKGGFVRWCSTLEKGFTFIEFKNISTIKLKKYAQKLEKKFKSPVRLVFKSKVKLKKKLYLGSISDQCVNTLN